ncbi:MAG TPA: DUF4376 domain-containing protein [Terriglobales bacterium]|nr:DUF4376 domain-containing protein [Terriglobales bacterium]
MLYAASTRGFYREDVHGENIPADAVEITDEQYAVLIEGQAKGGTIASGAGGFPILLPRTEPTIDQIKDAMWERIKIERDRRTQAGGYQVGMHWFHSDTFSRTQQLGLVLLGESLPPGVQWKTMSGDFVAMTPQVAQQVFAAAALSDIAVFAAAEAHKAAMRSSAEPESYDFLSGGWPETFEEASA